jgi:hypothetical protein
VGLGLGLSIGGAPCAPPFIPTIYSGCTLDLDAGVGFTPSSWADQSGAGNDVAQATGSLQPSATTVGDFAAVNFDGSDDRMVSAADVSTIITASAYTILAVVYIDAIDSADAVGIHNDGIFTAQNGVFGLCLKNTPVALVGHFNGAAFTQDTKTVATGALTLVACRYDGTKIYASVDGVDSSGTSSGNIASLTGAFEVGRAGQGPQYFDGKLFGSSPTT